MAPAPVFNHPPHRTSSGNERRNAPKYCSLSTSNVARVAAAVRQQVSPWRSNKYQSA
jgi:hypothetical protein